MRNILALAIILAKEGWLLLYLSVALNVTLFHVNKDNINFPMVDITSACVITPLEIKL